jgi:signal transduction histidine kinase
LAEEPGLSERWSSWLLARNRRGTKTVLWLVVTLYPLFGILDYLIAPPQWLGVLYGTRIFVTLVTLAMFRVVGSRYFERHAAGLSSSYMILISFGISLMTVHMGGLASPYYAGLSLTMIATGLLFVWPRHVVIGTYAAIVLSFIVPNLLFAARSSEFTAISNLFFLISIAVIAGTGQTLAYRTQREQVSNQLVIESTKANLERAHDRLQQLDKFKSDFFANVTHELKTPLTMILAPLELMLHGEMGRLTASQRASLESMLRNGTKLLKLIGDLLDLSKLDESRLRLQIGEHDLVSYLSDLVAQVQSLAQRKSIQLTFATNAPTSMVHCDLERLERVFVNLISNAAKFTPSGGFVRVMLEDKGPSVEIWVDDTGIGFPPEMADRIFERFVQVDQARTRKYGGTGIGLALARELVLLHGGTITANSKASGGALFRVELLKDREHFEAECIDRRGRREDRIGGTRAADYGLSEWQVEAVEKYRFIDIDEATEQRVLDRDAGEHARPQSVLIVEDTPDVIRVIHLALRRQFRVLAAPSGSKGLELATKHLPSLIITDFMMPEMDGMEMTRRLREDARTRHIPIVMLTARGDVEDRVAGLEAGVNAYLTKPFSAKELVSAVRGLVRIQETTADMLLKENMDSLETIAGGLAHEINNPLNYIKNALALLQTDATALLAAVRNGSAPSVVEKPSARMDRMFEVADTGVKRIGATVALMQRYSREGFSRVLQAVDVFESARDVVSMLQAGASNRMVETAFDGDGRLECVPEEMHQVLTNLVQNALDAIQPETGKVRVSGHIENDSLVLSVADNGSGISPENRARIFTPFYTTKEVGAGMGLGLTIVHRVVTSLGGTVSVTSQEGRGSEFTLRLPQRALNVHAHRALEVQ